MSDAQYLKTINSDSRVFLDLEDYEYLNDRNVDVIEIFGLKNGLKSFNVIDPDTKNSVSLMSFLFENVHWNSPLRRINNKPIKHGVIFKQVYDYRISNFKNVVRRQTRTRPDRLFIIGPYDADIAYLLDYIENMVTIHNVYMIDIVDHLISGLAPIINAEINEKIQEHKDKIIVHYDTVAKHESEIEQLTKLIK